MSDYHEKGNEPATKIITYILLTKKIAFIAISFISDRGDTCPSFKAIRSNITEIEFPYRFNHQIKYIIQLDILNNFRSYKNSFQIIVLWKVQVYKCMC